MKWDCDMNTAENNMDIWCAKTPCYIFYANRVKSFETWPKQMKQDKHQLAHYGFFYTKESDIVECFSCGVRIREWDVNDNPALEHKTHSPRCSYLKITGTEENLALDTCG